jgi:hypothetical protein
MTKTAFLLTLVVAALASIPAHAQPLRVFVSGLGLDTNPCTVTQPCRTFQHAHDVVAANGEIDVIDPAGYGPLKITKGISIQAHGFGGISQPAMFVAIQINVTTSDPVTLNGLLIDGAGTGTMGIQINSGPSVTILNSVVRHFNFGIFYQSSTNGANLLVEDTIASDNIAVGIEVSPAGGGGNATLNRITANNNANGVVRANGGNTTIANSVLSNNSAIGLDLQTSVTFLAKNVISGNATGVNVAATAYSYGDNYIIDNTIPVTGSLMSVMTR